MRGSYLYGVLAPPHRGYPLFPLCLVPLIECALSPLELVLHIQVHRGRILLAQLSGAVIWGVYLLWYCYRKNIFMVLLVMARGVNRKLTTVNTLCHHREI